MRTLEIILALFITISIIMAAFRRYDWRKWVSLSTAGVMALHLGIEGYRWQMVPLYGITLGLGIFSHRRAAPPNSESSTWKGAAIRLLGGLVILGAGILPPILVPVPRVPEPTGPYDVGTVTIMVVDESREELYSGNVGEPRKFMVQIWYPAEIGKGAKPAPWMDNIDVMGPAIANKLGLEDHFLDHIEYSKSHAYRDMPVAGGDETFPLLLLSHGWEGFRAQNTYQTEELASHGYIVAAPDHTYGAVATVFADGSVALSNPEALPSKKGLSDAEFLTAANLLGQQWAGDLSFILDYLEKNQPEGPAGLLSGRIDFDRVGALGHSTGGGASIEFCATDSRCKAALGMDPYMDPVSGWVLAEGLSQPYFAMFSEGWYGRGNERFNQFYQNHQTEILQFGIQGTAHYDFTDLPAFSPLAHALGLKGPLKGSRVLEIIKDYTLAFFDYYFKGLPSHLLKGPSDEYPELIW